MRRASVVSALTETLERAVSLRPGGDWSALARRLLELHAGEADASIPEYIAALDVAYRHRRLSYLEAILDQLAEGGRPAGDLIAASGETTFNTGNVQRQLAASKRLLDERRRSLIDDERTVRLRGVDDSTILQPAAELANQCYTHLEAVTAADDPDLDVAEVFARPEVAQAVGDFVDAVANELSQALASADQVDFAEAEPAGEAEPALAKILNRVFERAELLDQVVYPLRWPSLGEARKVDVHRVSPRDAASLVPMPDLGEDGEPTGPLRLAGVSLGHFGGFLDRGWRRNDMLWGRLDGAERLIAVLVPDGVAREELRVRAHAAILREEFQGLAKDELMTVIKPERRADFEDRLGEEDDHALVAAFASSYGGPTKLKRATASRIGARSMLVGGRVLGGLRQGKPAGVLLSPVAWALRALGAGASGVLGLVDAVRRRFKRG